jgi:hypothetical protein
MRKRPNVSLSVALLSLLVSGVACEGLVASNPAPPKGMTGTGGAAGSSVDPDAGIVIDPTLDAGTGGTTTGTGGAAGAGGAGTDGGPAPGAGGSGFPTTTPCGDYPVAPDLATTKFDLGTVVPNLIFKREDGTTVTLGELRCNKKNRLLYWTVGGDNCPPCISTAKAMEVPAAMELGPQGLLMMMSFNARRFLVSSSPWKGWRTKTMWPADNDSTLLVDEPMTMPAYAFPRITNGIPWSIVVDLETMKVVNKETRSITTLRTKLAATPLRQ